MKHLRKVKQLTSQQAETLVGIHEKRHPSMTICALNRSSQFPIGRIITVENKTQTIQPTFPDNFSSISCCNFCWTSGCLANSQAVNVNAVLVVS